MQIAIRESIEPGAQHHVLADATLHGARQLLFGEPAACRYERAQGRRPGLRGIVHRVSTWGNQLSLRIHLAWRWGELVIMQSHEDCVTFEHHIITEGEKRGEDSAEDHSHQYDLRDPIPSPVAENELQFFLSRVAQDLVEPPPEPEIPPGDEPSSPA